MNLINYLLSAGLILAAFFSLYRLVSLRSETFHMMNRSQSKHSRALKALFAPVLTVVILSLLAVTVHDRTTAGFRGINANNAIFGDSISILDARYGQGKFNLGLWRHATIYIQPPMDYMRVETEIDTFNTIPDLLYHSIGAGTPHGKPIYSVTVCLEDLHLDNASACGLDTIRPLLELMEGLGVRPSVVRSRAEAALADLSTYKYARIHCTGKDSYYMSHNGLVAEGSLRDMAEWINILDIQYVAFYPDASMPWTHAQKLMNVALARGARTFIVCQKEPDGQYRMTVLPTHQEATAKFSGKTVEQVADMLNGNVCNSSMRRTANVIEYPKTVTNDMNGVDIESIALRKDGLYITLRANITSRNIWTSPLKPGSISVSTGNKLYPLVSHEGLPEFDEYPDIQENGYASGRLCWLPERGVQYTLLHFEPVPDSITTFDLVVTEMPDMYLAKGISATESGTPNRDTQVFVPFSMPDMNGTTVNLADIINDPANRFVLLHYWKTADKYSIEDFPILKQLYEEYSPKGFRFVGISSDTDHSAWIETIRINGIGWLQLNSPAGEADITPQWQLIYCPTGRICAIGMHANNLNNILEVMTEGAQ